MIQWLRLCISNEGGAGLILSQWHKTDTASEEGQFNLVKLCHARVTRTLRWKTSGPPMGHTGKMQIPKGSSGRKSSSPTDTRFLQVSSITSLYKALWAGSRNSHSSWVNSMATSSEVSRSWNETTCHQKGHEKFSFSCKRERVVRGKDWLEVCVLTDPCRGIWRNYASLFLISYAFS